MGRGKSKLRLLIQVIGKRLHARDCRKGVVIVARGQVRTTCRGPFCSGGSGSRFAFINAVARRFRLPIRVDLDFANVAGIEGWNVRFTVRARGNFGKRFRSAFVTGTLFDGEKWIFANFVLDVGLKVDSGKLQKLDGLPQLRRYDDLLGLPCLKP